MKLKTRNSLFLAIALLIFSNVATQAQENKGIKFEHGLSWEEVKIKAKAENKYIFIDVLATWCAPCKAMEKDVYSNQELGNLINDKFISIKVQADTSKVDNNETKNWYADARKILADYEINGFPTLLFFSPVGKLVDRGVGYKDAKNFKRIAEDALNPDNQYYTQLERYNSGILGYSQMPELARKAKALGFKEQAIVVADKYVNNYLLKLNETDLLLKDHLSFIKEFIINTSSKAFNYFLTHSSKVNSILGENQSEYAIRSAISAEYLPKEETWKVKTPEWDVLEKKVANKFGALGLEVTYGERMMYCQFKKDWSGFGKYYILYFERAMGRPEYIVNNLSWTVFEQVDDLKVIAFATKVMGYAVEKWYVKEVNPEAFDTYANLLHRIGKTTEAIIWETRARDLRKGTPLEKQYDITLEKMKKGDATWVEPVKK